MVLLRNSKLRLTPSALTSYIVIIKGDSLENLGDDTPNIICITSTLSYSVGPELSELATYIARFAISRP